MRLPVIAALSLAVVLDVAPMVSGAADEPAPDLRASALLPASTIAGPHYTVEDRVTLEGYFYQFALRSDFGPFAALGRSELAIRINEIQAIAALQDVSKSEVFLKSAGTAVVNVGKSAASAVTDPGGTVKGIGSGIKRFGVNLGRASKRAATNEGGAETGESKGESAANTVLGVSSAMRRWAQKVGADPYTTNKVLRDSLKSIADVDAAGSIVTKIALPVPAVVGTTATVGDLVWSKDPEALRKLNEQRIKDLGTSEKAAGAFFRNGWYTLTAQTRLAAALDAVKRPGCADYVESASAAESEHEARFFVESAEMLQAFHAKQPVARLLTDSRAVVALSATHAVLLAPLDFVRETDAATEALTEIAGRARTDLHAAHLELRLTGKASARAKDRAKALGWTVVEGAPAR